MANGFFMQGEYASAVAAARVFQDKAGTAHCVRVEQQDGQHRVLVVTTVEGATEKRIDCGNLGIVHIFDFALFRSAYTGSLKAMVVTWPNGVVGGDRRAIAWVDLEVVIPA